MSTTDAERGRSRERSNHDVYRGPDSTPCFCWAESGHYIGEEVSVKPGPTPDTERDERLREARHAAAVLRRRTLPGLSEETRRDYIALDDEVTRQAAAIQAVRDLHKPVPYGFPETRVVAPWAPENVCSHCLAEYDGCVDYPCPTVRALDEAGA